MVLAVPPVLDSSTRWSPLPSVTMEAVTPALEALMASRTPARVELACSVMKVAGWCRP
jgi:hypothetical protein